MHCCCARLPLLPRNTVLSPVYRTHASRIRVQPFDYTQLRRLPHAATESSARQAAAAHDSMAAHNQQAPHQHISLANNEVESKLMLATIICTPARTTLRLAAQQLKDTLNPRHKNTSTNWHIHN